MRAAVNTARRRRRDASHTPTGHTKNFAALAIPTQADPALARALRDKQAQRRSGLNTRISPATCGRRATTPSTLQSLTPTSGALPRRDGRECYHAVSAIAFSRAVRAQARPLPPVRRLALTRSYSLGLPWQIVQAGSAI